MKKSKTMSLNDKKMYWAQYIEQKTNESFESFCKSTTTIRRGGYPYNNKEN